MKLILPIDIIDLKGEGLHLFFKARAGRKLCRLLIDTGASRTVFDETRFRRLLQDGDLTALNRLSTGLGTDSMVGFTGRIPKLHLGGISLLDYHAVVLNLSHVNSSYEMLGFPPIDGVLGSDLLHRFKAVIDYGTAELHLIRE